MNKKKVSVSFISLGCFKNTVDTEVLGGLLERRGIDIVSSYETADWLVINTCGFIRDAKEESIDEILKALEKKESGEVRHVAVMGCLTQRYTGELKKNFQEADIIWGVNDPEELADLIAGESTDQSAEYPDRELFLYNDRHQRIITTTPNTTFIKISEGCDMQCTFCVIPRIRGSYRSREIPSLLKEAELYLNLGFQELNLISQNSTYFGKDRAHKSQLPLLIKEIAGLGFKWIRLLYLMPEEVDDEIISAFAYPSVLPYFDLPFQHVSAKILKKMKRSGNAEKKLDLIRRIRQNFPQAVIRSTFIVGYPGETDEDFEELVSFARESRIERIGVFGYSDEEQTEAFRHKYKIAPEVIKTRREMLMDVSDLNMTGYNQTLTGSVHEFLPLGPCPWKSDSTIGRISSQAPEVDGLTQVDEKFKERYQIFPVNITGFQNEILYGERS